MKFPSSQMKLLKRKFGSPGEPSPGFWLDRLLLFPVVGGSRGRSGCLQALVRRSFLSWEICTPRCLTCRSVANDSTSCSLKLAVHNPQAAVGVAPLCAPSPLPSGLGSAGLPFWGCSGPRLVLAWLSHGVLTKMPVRI